MHKSNPPVSLADLSAAGIRLRPYEAVTIVRGLALQVARGEIAGVPSSHVIRLSSSGAISVEGPVGAGGPSVARAAQLLEALLPPADAGQQFRVPGGLRLVVARAIGAIDLPPFASLEAFAEALSRFAAADPAATVGNLVVTWNELVTVRAPQSDGDEGAAQAPLAQIEPFVAPRGLEPTVSRELTVSDIRRARRATGLTLAQIAKHSRVPLPLLRQLEWGYLLNWPSGNYGRTQLIRYARAAGLDEHLLLSTVTPLLLEAERRRTALARRRVQQQPPAEADEPVVEVEVLPVPEMARGLDGPEHSRWMSTFAALAIPALLTIALLPSWWARSSSRGDDIVTQGSRTPATAVSRSSRGPSPDQQWRTPPPARESQAERFTSPSAADTDTVATTGAADAEQIGTGRNNSNRPAHGFAQSGAADSPSFTTLGTATFHRADDDGHALIPAGSEKRDTVLRVTRIVDDGANNFHLRVSPDGTQIAFDSDRDGVRGVYVADADGKNVRRVSADGFGALPSWSADGKRLAFVRAETSRNEVWNLWTLDLSSGDLTQVTRHSSGQPWGGSWFPDGQRLAYGYGDRLVIRELQSGAERVFPSPRQGRRLQTPVVSPDGRRIVFHVERSGPWLLELSDGSMRRILTDPTAEEYAWSPDGRRIAYHSRKSDAWGVWVMIH